MFPQLAQFRPALLGSGSAWFPPLRMCVSHQVVHATPETTGKVTVVQDFGPFKDKVSYLENADSTGRFIVRKEEPKHDFPGMPFASSKR